MFPDWIDWCWHKKIRQEIDRKKKNRSPLDLLQKKKNLFSKSHHFLAEFLGFKRTTAETTERTCSNNEVLEDDKELIWSVFTRQKNVLNELIWDYFVLQ